MKTATNPDTGETLVLSGGQWIKPDQSATDSAGNKAFLVGGKWEIKTEGGATGSWGGGETGSWGTTKTESVNTPTTARNAIAARNDLVPQVSSVSRYNPNQSTPGYVVNEAAKNVMGLLSLPEAFQNAAGGTLFGPVAGLTTALRDQIGFPTMSKISRVLGIEPDMKAPGPGTELATGAGLDVAQNFMLPGGTVAQKIASGVGGYIGRKTGEAGGPAGEFTGQVIGSVVAPSLLATRFKALKSVASYLGKSGNEIKSDLESNPGFMEGLRKSAINDLAESLKKDPATYRENFAAAQELEKQFPGLKLNLGQTFLAPSVIQQQRALETSSGSQMNEAMARRTANEAILRRTLGENTGARGMATAALDDVDAAFGARSRALSAEIAKVSDEAAAIASKVSTADVPALGQKALDIRASELGVARGKANELMGLASKAAVKENAVFDPASVIAKAKEIQSQPIWDDANTTSIFGKIKGIGPQQDAGFDWNPVSGATPKQTAPTTVSFDDVKAWREAVNKDLASALRSNSPNARQQRYNLGQLKDAIDDLISKSPFENTKKAYGDFVSFYKHEFAPRFLRGVNLLAEKTTSLGETRLPPEKVFSSYFKKDGGLEMGRYIKLYGDNPEAMSTLKDAIIDRYSKEVVRDGVINPKLHDLFMDRYKIPLGVLDKAKFNFAKELNTVSSASQSVQERLVSLQDAASRADKSLVRSLIADKFGTKAPEQVIEEIFPNPRKTDLLLSGMNKDQAKGLVEFMKDDLVKSFTKNGEISADTIDAFLSDRGKVESFKLALSRVYSPASADQHLKTLQRISDVARRLDATPVPRASVTEGKPSIFHDSLQKETGLSIAVIGNMVRATITGRVSPEWAMMALGSQAGATILQNMKNDIYKQILSKPENAQLLLAAMEKGNSAGGIAAMGRYLKTAPHILNYFMGFREYPNFVKYALANYGREQAEPQE